MAAGSATTADPALVAAFGLAFVPVRVGAVVFARILVAHTAAAAAARAVAIGFVVAMAIATRSPVLRSSQSNGNVSGANHRYRGHGAAFVVDLDPSGHDRDHFGTEPRPAMQHFHGSAHFPGDRAGEHRQLPRPCALPAGHTF